MTSAAPRQPALRERGGLLAGTGRAERARRAGPGAAGGAGVTQAGGKQHLGRHLGAGAQRRELARHPAVAIGYIGG